MTFLVSSEEFGNAQRPCGRQADDKRVGDTRALVVRELTDVVHFVDARCVDKLRYGDGRERVVIESLHHLQARMAPNGRRTEIVCNGGEILDNSAARILMH